MDARTRRRRTRIRKLLVASMAKEESGTRWNRLATKYVALHGLSPEAGVFVRRCLFSECIAKARAVTH